MDFTKLGYYAEDASFSDVFKKTSPATSTDPFRDAPLPGVGPAPHSPGKGQGRLFTSSGAPVEFPPVPKKSISQKLKGIGNKFTRFAKDTLSKKKTIAGAAIVGALATNEYLNRDKGIRMNKAASARDLMLASFTASIADDFVKEAVSLGEAADVVRGALKKGKGVIHRGLDVVEDVAVPPKSRMEVLKRNFQRAARDLPDSVRRTMETLKFGEAQQIGRMAINPPHQGKFRTKVMRDEHGNVSLEHFIREAPTSMHRGMRQGIEGKPMSSGYSMLSDAVEPGVLGAVAGGALGGVRGALKGGLIGAGYGAYKGRQAHGEAYSRGAGALERMREIYGPGGPYGLRPVDKPGGTAS